MRNEAGFSYSTSFPRSINVEQDDNCFPPTETNVLLANTMPKGGKLPQFIEQKVRLWYRLTNANRTGFVDKSDFAYMADTFVNEYNLEGERATELRTWLVNGWEKLIEFGRTATPGDKNIISHENTPVLLLVGEKISSGERITEDMYINAFTEIMNINPDLFKLCFSKMLTCFFNIFDTDRDGFLTVDDLVRGLGCFGIEQKEPLKKVFSEMDKAGSGQIDQDTYIGAWVEFVTGEKKDAPLAKYFNPSVLSV